MLPPYIFSLVCHRAHLQVVAHAAASIPASALRPACCGVANCTWPCCCVYMRGWGVVGHCPWHVLRSVRERRVCEYLYSLSWRVFTSTELASTNHPKNWGHGGCPGWQAQRVLPANVFSLGGENAAMSSLLLSMRQQPVILLLPYGMRTPYAAWGGTF